MTPAFAVLFFVTLERLAELWLAQRNTTRLIQQGAVEFGSRHYPVIVLLHAAWLVGLWLLAWDRDVVWIWLLAFIGLQSLRVWVLMTLKYRWTTRIIVVPHSTLIVSGPYRFIKHPNYVVVIGEIATLPMSLGLPWFAFIFTILNAIVLFVRVRVENAALIHASNRE